MRGSGGLTTRGIGFVTSKLRVDGNASVVARLASLDLASGLLRGEVQVRVDDVRGGFDPLTRTTDFAAASLVASASSTALDLAHPSLEGVDAHLSVDRAVLADARSLGAFLPSPDILAIESGSAVAHVELGLRAEDHAAGGVVDVTLADAGLKLHETHFRGDVAVEAQLRGLDWATGALDVTGSRVSMREIAITGASTDTARWQGISSCSKASSRCRRRLDSTPTSCCAPATPARSSPRCSATDSRGSSPGW